MKTILLLFFVLGAGRLAAQSVDPANGTNAFVAVSDYRLIMHPQRNYSLRGDRVVYDGLAVELFEAKNPVNLLTAPQPDQPSPTVADRVWEQTKSDRTGLNIFSIKF